MLTRRAGIGSQPRGMGTSIESVSLPFRGWRRDHAPGRVNAGGEPCDACTRHSPEAGPEQDCSCSGWSAAPYCYSVRGRA